MNQKLQGVSLDVDNLLYDLESVHQSFVKRVYGVDLTSLDVVDWDFYMNNYPKILEVWTKWDEYSQGQLFKEAASFVDDLRQITNVQIVTATGSQELVKQKDDMLLDAFGDIKIIHAKNKSEFTQNTILIDDAPHNIECHINTNTLPGILFDYQGEFGWTKDFDENSIDLAQRVLSHNEALLKSEELLKQFS